VFEKISERHLSFHLSTNTIKLFMAFQQQKLYDHAKARVVPKVMPLVSFPD
jgi:hypothetical protein